MKVQHFFDEETFTLTYVVFDETTKDALVIDPVLNFDQPSGVIKDHSFSEVMAFIKNNDLRLHLVLETHAHADHLSSSQLIKKSGEGVKVAISERIKIVQKTFKEVFNLENFNPDGADFDLLVRDDQAFRAGSISILPIPSPGHTPACTSFLIEDCLFTGDAIFMPDYGTGRCDFPGGSAEELYQSIKRLYQLPDQTKVYVGHDYRPGGRELRFQTSIGESKRSNIHLSSETTQKDFVNFRKTRDQGLSAPRLLLPSLQVNIAAGNLPKSENNGTSYLKLPLRVKLSHGKL